MILTVTGDLAGMMEEVRAAEEAHRRAVEGAEDALIQAAANRLTAARLRLGRASRLVELI